jgi:IS1 transposase/Domain of unknown function (DUF4351)
LLKALLEPFGIMQFYSDGWGAYERHIDPVFHTVGKRNTQKIERKHLTLRTRIKRLARKTICFSKSVVMHDVVIGLFINRVAFSLTIPWTTDLEHYQTDEPELVLRSVAAKIEEITERKVQADLAATTSVLAGLVLDRNQVKRILRRDIMRESVIYQDILEEGLERGRQQERALVSRQLTKKIGNLTPKIQERVNVLSIDRVESLGEALLDFTTLADLERFLDS